MKVDLIFTFENREQEWFDMSFNPEFMNSKKDFFRMITDSLDNEEKADLVKVSCCVTGLTDDFIEPEWYAGCNGKFWDDEIPQLMAEIWNIESTITPLN